MPWTVRARPDLDEYIRQRQANNLTPALMTAEFSRQIAEHHRRRRKVMRVLEYVGVLVNGLDKLGVEWKRVYSRQLKFQPLFARDGDDPILDDWFIARFDHKIFNKRGGIVFQRVRDKRIINSFGNFRDAMRFFNDPDTVFAEHWPRRYPGHQ